MDTRKLEKVFSNLSDSVSGWLTLPCLKENTNSCSVFSLVASFLKLKPAYCLQNPGPKWRIESLSVGLNLPVVLTMGYV